jgi:hypothetical protein
LKESIESSRMGRGEVALANEFARVYVSMSGQAVKAYAKVFNCTRQNALCYIDAYMDRQEVKDALAKVTAPTEFIAEPGEVLQKLTTILRAAQPKEALKAAELLLRVRGQLDRQKREKKDPITVMIQERIKAAAALSPGDLEKQLTAGDANEEVIEVEGEEVMDDR